MVNLNWLRLNLSVTLLALMASGCATQSAPPPSEPEKFPELPSQGRASLVPIPSECSQGCLSGLTVERKRSLSMLTGSPLPAPSANAPGTPDYSLPPGSWPKR